MHRDAAWPLIDDRRRAIADLLTTIETDAWNRPSLCEGWTIREVAGHLTQQQQQASRLTGVVHSLVGGQGAVADRIALAAQRTSVRPTGALIADLRGMTSRRRIGEIALWPRILLEVLVHGEDIARPLGRPLPMPVPGALEAAQRVWSGRHWRAQQRFAGFCLTADDTDWVAGEGPRVTGPIAQLLMVLTGRAVVDHLSGPGQPALAARLRQESPSDGLAS